MSKKSRIFNIMQYELHPDTLQRITMTDADGNIICDKDGQPVNFGLTLEKVEAVVLKYKSIKRWAYIKHDADVYSLKDEEANADHKQGNTKPPHWHVVIESDNAIELDTVAKWFCIPAQFIDVPKGGRRAFLDCVEYLTHESPKEQQQKKTLYSDDKVVANFDWREALDARKDTGEDYTRRELLRLKVIRGEMTLREIKEKFPLDWIADEARLRAARSAYVFDFAPMPVSRVNYYLTGSGGDGKGLASRAVARSLFPDIENDEELFFVVGAGNVAFEGYDAQPVIIWDDFRAFDLLTACGGRGNFFNIFDTHPTSGAGARQNIKHGSTRLVNCVNIVNSVQPWKEFLDALVGEYEDAKGVKHKSEMAQKSQSYRRFPIIMPLNADDFEVLINKGVMEGTREFEDYYHFRNLRGNFYKVASRCLENEAMQRAIEARMLQSIPEAHQLALGSSIVRPSDEELLAEFADVGKPLEVIEFEKKVVDLQQKFAQLSQNDPAGFVQLSGIMNIEDPALRSVVLSLLYGKNMKPDGTEYTEAEVADARAQLADYAAEWDKVPLKDRPDVIAKAKGEIEDTIKAVQLQTVGGIVCPASCTTDKDRVDYALQHLRLNGGDPAIIAELEDKRFDLDGRELPAAYVKAAKAREASQARRK